MVKHQYSKNSKSLIFMGLFFIVSNVFSQSYIKVNPFVWPLYLNEVIIYSPAINEESFKNTDKFQIVEKINPLGYYKLKFQNASKTFRTFRRVMKQLKGDTLIKDIFPIFKLGITTSDVNFKRIGFSSLNLKESRVLYKKLYTLLPSYQRILEKHYRNSLKKLVEFDLSFNIKNQKPTNIEIKSDILSDYEKKEMMTLIKNQLWLKSDTEIKVRIKPLIFKEIK